MHLVLLTTTDWELKSTRSTSQLSVHLSVGIESVVHTTSLLLIQNNLQHLASILLSSQSLADNLNRVDHISEDSVVDGSKCSGTRSLLCLRGSGSVRSLWSRKNAAGSKEENVSVGEFFFKFSGKSLLDLVEVREERNWDENYDSALAMANFEL